MVSILPLISNFKDWRLFVARHRQFVLPSHSFSTASSALWQDQGIYRALSSFLPSFTFTLWSHNIVTLWVGYIHIHVYTRVCVHPYMCACVRVYIYIYIYTPTHMCVETHTHLHTHTHIYTHIYVARWVRFGLGIQFHMLGKPIN